MSQYTVDSGDDIMSIAFENGLLWETVWNDPGNAQLKQLRKDPGMLFKGDVVVIPVVKLRSESAPTDQLAKFVKRIALVQVRLRMLDYKRKPRPNLKYVAHVDGSPAKGQTDGDGYITLKVKPNAKKVVLKLIDGKRSEEYTLPLGCIDPISEPTGVQQRLANLGYPCLSEEGTLGEATTTAITAFQKEMNLNVSGDIDAATRQKLKEIHGS